jgi:hypothetical protein
MDALRKGVTGAAARVFGLLAVLAGSTARASEADLVLPDFASQSFLDGALNGHQLLLGGIAVCVVGLVFGFIQYGQLRRLPVHKSMLEISELIYETCKTYLITQGKFILALWGLLLVVMVGYFGFLQHMLSEAPSKLLAILAFSLIGIAGSYGVAWFGIRVNTFANSRTAFASLRGKPYPTYAIARALIHQPRLLILDEATSNLDPEAQDAIVETVAHLKTTMAVLAVAHQEKMVRVADQVLRLNGGRLVPLNDGEGRAALSG